MRTKLVELKNDDIRKKEVEVYEISYKIEKCNKEIMKTTKEIRNLSENNKPTIEKKNK
jgi:hypothetical protein